MADAVVSDAVVGVGASGGGGFGSSGVDRGGGQEHFKLFNPQPDVEHILDMVGFNTIFKIFSNLDEAVNSF